MSAKRCKGARNVVRISSLSPRERAGVTARRARCGAIPSLASKALRCKAALANMSSASQSTLAPASIARITSQARCATCAGLALGARTSAAATAASRASSPCAALPKSVRESASMPTISPRKGTLLR